MDGEKEKRRKRRKRVRLTRKEEKKERRERRQSGGRKERKRGDRKMDPKRIRLRGLKTPEKINEKKIRIETKFVY